MKVTYDPGADALYIMVCDARRKDKVVETECCGGDGAILIDRYKRGCVGIEILRASKTLAPLLRALGVRSKGSGIAIRNQSNVCP